MQVAALDTSAVAERLREALAPLPVRFALLYGSYAAGRPTPVSDLDVAVYADSRGDFLTAVAALTEAFPGRRVDVVNLKGKPALLYYEVLATGTPLLVRDEDFFAAETYRTMRAYLDFKPTYDRILQHMHRRIEEGTYGQRRV